MILVSQCLAGDFCRWDGGTNLVPEIKVLVDSGLAVTACPEVLGHARRFWAACLHQEKLVKYWKIASSTPTVKM